MGRPVSWVWPRPGPPVFRRIPRSAGCTAGRRRYSRITECGMTTWRKRCPGRILLFFPKPESPEEFRETGIIHVAAGGEGVYLKVERMASAREDTRAAADPDAPMPRSFPLFFRKIHIDGDGERKRAALSLPVSNGGACRSAVPGCGNAADFLV